MGFIVKTCKVLEKYKGLWILLLSFKLNNIWSSKDLTLIWIQGSDLTLKSMQCHGKGSAWLYDSLALGPWANGLTSWNHCFSCRKWEQYWLLIKGGNVSSMHGTGPDTWYLFSSYSLFVSLDLGCVMCY